MNPYQLNFCAYKYAESAHSEILSLCDPLLTFGIKVFAYFRFFNDGRYIYLCNNLEWIEFCLQNVHNNEGTSLGEEITHVPKDNYHCFLWPIKKSDYLMSALYEFNIWNGLSIFKQREDSIELWGFAGDRKIEGLQNFYIENIEILKDFTSTFNMNASEIISPKKDCLAIYKNFKKQGPVLNEQEEEKIRAFIKATPIHKYPIIFGEKEIYLSDKEIQCVNLLSSGKNAKQIASNLKLSPRTVEKHFENIKNKIGCESRDIIIKTYKESILNWL